LYFAIPIRPRSRSIRPIAPKSSRSGRLKAFFDAWFKTRDGQFVAAFQSYGSTDDFAEKIEDCPRQWLAKRGLVRQEPVWDRVCCAARRFPASKPSGPIAARHAIRTAQSDGESTSGRYNNLRGYIRA